MDSSKVKDHRLYKHMESESLMKQDGKRPLVFDDITYDGELMYEMLKTFNGREVEVFIVYASARLNWPTLEDVAEHIGISIGRCRSYAKNLEAYGLLDEDATMGRRRGGRLMYWAVHPEYQGDVSDCVRRMQEAGSND